LTQVQIDLWRLAWRCSTDQEILYSAVHTEAGLSITTSRGFYVVGRGHTPVSLNMPVGVGAGVVADVLCDAYYRLTNRTLEIKRLS